MDRQDIALNIVWQELQELSYQPKFQVCKIVAYPAFQISRFILKVKRDHYVQPKYKLYQFTMQFRNV